MPAIPDFNKNESKLFRKLTKIYPDPGRKPNMITFFDHDQAPTMLKKYLLNNLILAISKKL